MFRSSNTVEFKGYGSDINIILDNDADFADIESDLIKKLEKSDEFFTGRKIVLDVGDRILSLEECNRLNEILNSTFGLIISHVRSNASENRKLIEDCGWQLKNERKRNNNAVKPKTDKEAKNTENRVSEDENRRLRTLISNTSLSDTHLIKGTIRGGQTKAHRGNIVIIGDVNPGAEIIATGDIIVIGKLRGVAHAGAQGDTSATIIALDLRPIQLRIAGCIGRSPDADIGDTEEKKNELEIAEIEDGQIVIHKLK